MEIKWIINILLLSGLFVGLYGIFQKAKRPGWYALIPVWNLWVWIKILQKPWWWIIILFIPGVNLMLIMVMAYLTMRNFEVENTLLLIAGVVAPFFVLPYLAFTNKFRYMSDDFWRNYTKGWKFETLEAISFAIIVATIIRTFFIEAFTIPTPSMEKSLMVGDFLFVNKMSYGAKTPQTPLTIPLTHHTMPLTQTVPSYSEWISLPLFRLPAMGKVKNNDVVVFNYPDGDTVAMEMQNVGYHRLILNHGYNIVRARGLEPDSNLNLVYELGRKEVWKKYTIRTRPIDKRDNYVKRCVGIPGDQLEIKNTQLYINGKAAINPELMQIGYFVRSAGNGLSQKLLDKLDITDGMRTNIGNEFLLNLNEKNKERLVNSGQITNIVPNIQPEGQFDFEIFPHSPQFPWNKDNYGPITIPAKGSTIELNQNNLPLYKRIIQAYEGNTLEIKEGRILINGKESNTYTFNQDYYFLMGDNRHNSADSRSWGFVPFDHVVGKAVFVWFSRSQNRGFPNIRFERLFTFISDKGISRSYFFHIMIPLILLILLYNKRHAIKEKIEDRRRGVK
ncbi:MAG: signal peptidase I [Flavobacteriales bacterium]